MVLFTWRSKALWQTTLTFSDLNVVCFAFVSNNLPDEMSSAGNMRSMHSLVPHHPQRRPFSGLQERRALHIGAIVSFRNKWRCPYASNNQLVCSIWIHLSWLCSLIQFKKLIVVQRYHSLDVLHVGVRIFLCFLTWHIVAKCFLTWHDRGGFLQCYMFAFSDHDIALFKYFFINRWFYLPKLIPPVKEMCDTKFPFSPTLVSIQSIFTSETWTLI